MSTGDTDAFFTGTQDPMARLEDERRRLVELGKVWREASTTVMSKDKTFSMTFDGRGDLTDITFHGTKYRTLAPLELAHRLVETMRRGRLESIEKMAATMGTDAVPGLDVVGIATGKVDPSKVVEQLMAPLLEGLDTPPRITEEPRRG